MSDYAPIFQPGDAITLTASATIVGGNTVAVSGSSTVAPAITASAAKTIGVAAFDAAANSLVTVFGRGPVHETVAAGAITAGDQVVAGSVAGTVSSLAAAAGNTTADINNARTVLGVALTTAVDTAKVQWMEI